MSEDNKPNPGSQEAIELGCRCPVIDNGHGQGAYQENGVWLFWINGDCPIHGLELTEAKDVL
jgi:hypothetical protein